MTERPGGARDGYGEGPGAEFDDAEIDGFEDELLDDGEPCGAADLAAPAGRLAWTVTADAAGMRLDKALAGAFPGLSRSRLKALLDQGMVSLDGRTLAEASRRVKPGQAVEIEVPEPEAALPEPEDIPLRIVHEDEDLLVIDKPAGLVVHPAAGNPRGTLVNALLHHCGSSLSGIGGVRRPGIVHRLDKDTSGLIVVAKTAEAHAGLSAQFADRSLSRTYLALVYGLPSPPRGEVEAPIGRSPQDRKRMAVVREGTGKPALTRYAVIRGFRLAAALVECTLMTGRTHQIRVHMAHIGHPLVGDPVYGGRTGRASAIRARGLPEPATEALVSFGRQALHAAKLRFVHPRTGTAMSFESPVPADMEDLLRTLERL
ncbi:RluA family pseudouridine synthase [Arenibaculum pallidiluteum]|uniref:RluA family pseudouridine synthase n=1 Tax=Arenibaculum pallidiluteum TaxID=2812559 RepID=UPI0038B23900